MRERTPTPPGFWTVWTAVAVDLLGFGIILPLLPLYAERFGAGPLAIGLLFASYSLAQMVFAPLWGRISDRVGRRPVLLVAIAGSAVGSLVLGLAGSLAVLFVGRIIDGASGATVAVARATVADAASPTQRPRLMGLLGAAFGLGFVAGPALGAAATLAGPSVPFFAAAAISLLNLAAALARLPETRTAAATMERSSAGWRDMSGPVLRFVLITFLALTGFSAFEATLALFGSDRFEMSESVVALVFAGLGVVFVGVQGLAVGPVTGRIGEAGALRLGVTLGIVGYLGIAAAGSWPLLAGGLGLLAVGQGLLTPALSSAVAAAAPYDRAGAALGLQHAAGGFARLVGPVLGGGLFTIAGSLPFVAGACLAIVALFLIVPMTRRDAVPSRVAVS
ncbi:MAG: MFS transporter [Actinobacteria bacterium]|nr:MFS transporter [Actinomycetota bacterium]MBU1492831.1 MFS transporter [Actinomycetota bacterium]MBU1865659.1 MFS transporter [Actinomycetota bacterium]